MDILKPGQMTPSDFERIILLRIADENPTVTAALKAVLPALHVVSREYTGVGSFTNFAPVVPLPELTARTYDLQQHLIRLPQLELGLDAILFCHDGRPEFLELVAFGESWDGRCEGFRIE